MYNLKDMYNPKDIMTSCTNKPCPLRQMCGLSNDTQAGEFFEYKTLKGHDYQGNIRYTHGCDHFEKKKDIFQICDEVYGKLEPTELEKDVD